MSDTPDLPMPAATATPVPLPPPVPQAAAVPRQRARSGAVIGIVVGVVAGGGAIAGLLNATRATGSDDKPTDPIEISQPAPVAPAVADAGTVPVPITVPGPAVAPPVTTAPSVTAPPITGPSSTTPAGSADTTPEIAPPTETPTETPVAVGETIEMASGVSFALPDGWEVIDVTTNFAAVSNGSASVYVNLISGSSSASAVLADYQNIITQAVDGAEIGEIEPATIYSNLLIEAAAFGYRGYVGQGQSGSTPVRGVVFGDLRFDGVAIVTDVMFIPADDGGMSEQDSAGTTAFFTSFQYGE